MNAPFNVGKPWMTHEEQTVVMLLGEGWGYREIATTLGRTPQTVKDRAWRLLGPTRDRKKPDMRPRLTISKEELPALYAEGWRVESFEGASIFLVWPHETK